ncbi:major facilitator superfamily domain-containing protein [Paraphysoderma sedebokerense]|nr:major facilitator superfamily domain-containing protein [Paraphysoderma sedebokerense]
MVNDSVEKFDKGSEAAVLRKIDRRLMPFLGLCYLLSFLDRANIANARISNSSSGHDLAKVLSLTEQQMQWSISIFFVGYVLFEVPSNIMLKKFSPSRWIARIMFTWGLTCAGMGFVRDFTGLFICRLVLGIFEAGFFPGIVFYLTFWYRPEEQSFRIAMFYIASTLSGVVGGILAYFISFMNGFGGMEGWRWIFILEGLPTAVVGVITWFYLPDYPNTAGFLSSTERDLVVRRLQNSGANSSHDKAFDRSQFLAIISKPTTYLFCVIYFLFITPLYSFTFAFPTILNLLGYKDLMAQLLSTPPYLVAMFFTIFVAYQSDIKRQRSLYVAITLIVAMIGFLGMMLGPNASVKYFFSFLACSGAFAAVPPFLSWLSNNTLGSTQTAVATAMTIATGNIGGVINSFLYPKSHAPHYVFGHSINVAFLALAVVLTGVLRRTYSRGSYGASGKQYIV